MKFTLSWLKEYLDTDASLEQIIDCLTMIGLEVEQILDRAKLFVGYAVQVVELWVSLADKILYNRGRPIKKSRFRFHDPVLEPSFGWKHYRHQSNSKRTVP